ncbi:MAG: transglutaminase-like domain-containing protein [Candidatus Bathyarchaeia archaeon]
MTGKIKDRLYDTKWWFSRQLSYRQFLPSKEDLESNEAKELSKLLVGDSCKETLTNIVEWQERNIQYWDERADMFTLLLILSITAFVFVLIPVQQYLWILPLIVLCFLFLGDFMTFFISALFLTIYIIIAILVFVYVANTSVIIMAVGLSVIFGSILSLLLYGILKYRHLKRAVREFKFEDAFKLSLPVKKILQYRLAICRDYAKLTAALLINSFNSKDNIYFMCIPNHVATAMEIKGRIYFLDQHLPIKTREKWIEYWSRRYFDSFLSRLPFQNIRKRMPLQLYKLIVEDGEIRMNEVSRQKMHNVKNIPRVDVNTLTKKIVSKLGIKQISDKSEPDAKITFRYFALYCDEDEIVEFSLLKAIINRLHSELCDNMRKITKIEMLQNEVDLILKIYLG